MIIVALSYSDRSGARIFGVFENRMEVERALGQELLKDRRQFSYEDIKLFEVSLNQALVGKEGDLFIE